MRYLALATDYDGTLAHDGRVDEPTREALRRLKETGRKLILVTGRELDELLEVCPEIGLFDRVVAENGALLYRPDGREEKALATPPPPEFAERLKERGVGPISVGRVIVATWEPHQAAVLDVVREMGLELQVIFNKGAVMILPSGVNKATGLDAALRELMLSPHNVVAVGDAENDHAFLGSCECAVAVSNALDMLKERADWTTPGARGEGVVELIEALEANDLAELEPRLGRHHILLGHDDEGGEVRVAPYGRRVMVAGTSGGGKSTLTTGFLERLAEARYQFVIIDPEGDYTDFELAVTLGDPKNAPSADAVVDLLVKPEAQDASVNLLGIPLADRPAFSDGLLPRLQELLAKTGRPHWTVVDEAHHLMPRAWTLAPAALPSGLGSALFITVHPDSVASSVLEAVDILLAVGKDPEGTIRRFCEASGRAMPAGLEPVDLGRGETLAWFIREDRAPFRVKTVAGKSELRRHGRKYAEGNLGPDRSFYFRGPEGRFNLRAQNLQLFLQLAEGVDDPTWLHHLQQGDYARWFREEVKNDELAEAAGRIAAEPGLSAADSRARIREAVEERYTLPAEPAESATDPSKFG
ncbi:Sugar phosphatase YbiV [Aquisphaera giovannonii]|uniref:Sugar phosphatase YbiV n=1 Tax=Aquisphaera giovannonii TaxID=406548 RepID=A0A5B9WDV8_9BACT|nr:HAD-IIB family hydrolase [Aquisphaera giovannonii]QEH38151.1 Sugar phosphatase YbiV [Aquisphaera giovannonii]